MHFPLITESDNNTRTSICTIMKKETPNIMSNVNFMPWVGQNYQSGLFRGKKILVLGESHYCKEPLEDGGCCFPSCSKTLMDNNCKNLTINVINEIKNQDWKARTFSNFERSVFGKIPSQDERELFWDCIMFYNYLQYAQSGPTRPLEQTPDAYEESEKAFKELLEYYMPDYIIAWGNRLYNIVPDWGGESTTIEIPDKGRKKIWTYEINRKKIPTLFIHHPCWPGYSWKECHPFIRKFLGFDEKE